YTPTFTEVRLTSQSLPSKIVDGSSLAMARPQRLALLPKDSRFLVYTQSGGLVNAMLVALDLKLVESFYIKNIEANSGPPDNSQVTGCMDAWDRGPFRVMGGDLLGGTAFSRNIELLKKPVEGHPDMVLVVPGVQLTPGVYTL